MLKDRRALLEADILKLNKAASELYLEIVKGETLTEMNRYDSLRKQIMELDFDLKTVNELIAQGYE
jgi:hypothetical protein